MSLPERTTVLIIGAGPSGLSTALSLVHQGFRDLVIVEARSSRRELASRAMTIHASTLEALDSIGCAESLIRFGIKGQGIVLSDRSKTFLSVDFSCLAPYTRFPFVLLLPQTVTEDVLEARLQATAIQVVKAEKASGLRVSDDGELEVSFESGKVIKANYVVGADGAKSSIRQMAGIGFSDPDGNFPDERLAQLVLADVIFSSDSPILPANKVMGTVSAGGVFLTIPLPKHDESSRPVHRIGFNVPITSGPPPSNPPTSYLQQYLNEQGPIHLSSDPSVNPNPVHISTTMWATRYRTHAAIADKFLLRMSGGDLRSTVLLVGDAAHIHSPAGGLGMNLGIRDAIALGSVLGGHMNSYNDSLDTLLAEYASTRRSRALATIRLTKRIMSIAGMLASSTRLFGLHWLFSLIVRIPLIQRTICWNISGLGNR
ncbi:FAD/NAD(P)-binding domain-containing protein [Tricholoma matsutake]|nr:FAD/NAD(P)-binding domain-containing protein [Tricholoma matsutake 945]